MLRPVFRICHQLRSLSSVWTSTVAPRDDLVQKPCRNHEILPCHQQHIFHRSVSSLAKRCLFWRVCLELEDVAARLQLLHDLFRHSHWLEWTLEIPKNDYKFTLCIDVSVILATQWGRFEPVIRCDINLKSEGRITRKNLVHFRRNLKQKSCRKIQKSYKNPKNLIKIPKICKQFWIISKNSENSLKIL